MIQNIPQDKGILFSLSKLRESVWGSTYFWGIPITIPSQRPLPIFLPFKHEFSQNFIILCAHQWAQHLQQGPSLAYSLHSWNVRFVGRKLSKYDTGTGCYPGQLEECAQRHCPQGLIHIETPQETVKYLLYIYLQAASSSLWISHCLGLICT